MKRILVIGCGYVGLELAKQRIKIGDTVFGLNRSERSHEGLLSIQGDVTRPNSLDELPEGLDAVVYSVSSSGFTDDHYRAAYVDGVRNVLQSLSSRGETGCRFLFVSTTSVYGQEDGSVVDEDSPTTPLIFAGQRMLEAERLVQESNFERVILRLGGIFGPGRERTVRSVLEGNAVCYTGDPRVMNRNHRDDCAGALSHLIDLEQPKELYLGVDHEPVLRNDLLNWIADSCAVPRPRVAPLHEAPKSSRPSNKRCSNRRLIESGYAFRYPTYRDMPLPDASSH